MPPHPPAHGGVLVRGVIVQDQMQLERGRRLRSDLLEEPDELLMSMARHTVADDRAVEHAQCREQGRRAVALIIVRHRATAAFLHREARLGAIQGLDLAFLVDAQDEGMRGWVQVQAHHILHFVLEVRVATELEGTDQMGLEAVRLPHALHQGGVGPQLPGQRPRGPVGGGGGSSLGGGVQDLRFQRLPILGRAPAPRGVALNPRQPVRDEALSPEPHGLSTSPHGCGDMRVLAWPSAASRITLARSTRRTGVRRPRAHWQNCVRSSSVNSSCAALRMRSPPMGK